MRAAAGGTNRTREMYSIGPAGFAMKVGSEMAMGVGTQVRTWRRDRGSDSSRNLGLSQTDY